MCINLPFLLGIHSFFAIALHEPPPPPKKKPQQSQTTHQPTNQPKPEKQPKTLTLTQEIKWKSKVEIGNGVQMFVFCNLKEYNLKTKKAKLNAYFCGHLPLAVKVTVSVLETRCMNNFPGCDKSYLDCRMTF